MDTYRVVLYVTQEQEDAIRTLFYDSGWSYLKASLAVVDYNPQDTQTFLEQLCRESSILPSTDDFLELECSQSICDRKFDTTEPLHATGPPHATVEPVDTLRASVLSDDGVTKMPDLIYPSNTCRDYMEQLNTCNSNPSTKRLHDFDICDDLQFSLPHENEKFDSNALEFEKDVHDTLRHIGKADQQTHGNKEQAHAPLKNIESNIVNSFQFCLESQSYAKNSGHVVEKPTQAYLNQQSDIIKHLHHVDEQTAGVSRMKTTRVDSVESHDKGDKPSTSRSALLPNKSVTSNERSRPNSGSDNNATDTGSYQCGICYEDFSNISAFNSHKKDGQCKFTCPYCDKEFTRKTHSKFKAHVTSHRNEREYKCTQCNKAYNFAAKLNNHMLKHCDNKQYICDVCGISCTYLSTLKSHRQNMHSETGERYTCSICGISLKSNYNLKYHIRQVHTDDRPYQCQVCKLRYKTKYVYLTHMGTHDDNCEFKCTQCEKIFKRKSLLNAHMKLHNQQFSHICQTCQKGFHTNNKLLIHTRTHTGEKPYKCEVCEYSSAIKGNLTKHQRRHEDDDTENRLDQTDRESADKEESHEEPIGLLNTSTFDAFDALDMSNLSTVGFSAVAETSIFNSLHSDDTQFSL